MTTGIFASADPRQTRLDDFRRYLIWTVTTILISGLIVFGINWLIDPMWRGAGNRLFGMNYAFNERFSKAYLYAQKPNEYDCIIFGNSRVTLLDQSNIRGARCFNFSFSDGRMAEYLPYARYVASQGALIQRVVIGVDELQFQFRSSSPPIPDFINTRTTPPTWLETDLSLDVLGFSLRTLARQSPMRRYYTHDFIGDVIPGTRAARRGQLPDSRDRSVLDPDRSAAIVKKLRALFPGARFVGYVPPVASWFIAELERERRLPRLLRAQHQLAKEFDIFLDFAIPSRVTDDPANTYDGSHYFPAVNRRIAAMLSGAEMDFGIRITGIPTTEYYRRYRRALTDLGLLAPAH